MQEMHNVSVGIIGASGFTGMEATRLVSRHPRLRLRFATSDRWAGERLAERVPGVADGAMTFATLQEGLALASECQVVLLATPAETSLELAPKILKSGARVVDLSGAFRLRGASLYPQWYGFEHKEAALLAESTYSIPELSTPALPKARLVANPGCYATAAILPLAPLLSARLLDPDSIVINAASGVSGAGRKVSEEFSFMELDGNFRAYRVLKHQHTPEINQALTQAAGSPINVGFTPHLLPVKRGILCTTFARLRRAGDVSSVGSVLRDAFTQRSHIRLASAPEEVTLTAVVGTPDCLIGHAVDGQRLVLISAIDNLLKGAASQAIQNVNLMLGWSESLGLDGGRAAS
jgi:N-acetyl-gamma-glutamyl-phosphate reductase